ncbi:hypothetical protein CERZMDRAFT_110653 [Cercospora zeae-maydis SCOH1-5]|uniref:Aminotransferase class III n=1 Tax=Cercospora zeae-maydis SCOH1-5 TaxID=717836 RepID=A0A6A6FM59_9PEZI|nr:hypothetical protein CERZMDRAFT_110653 [Cercospora zeae-maydis SCOH1-5]
MSKTTTETILAQHDAIPAASSTTTQEVNSSSSSSSSSSSASSNPQQASSSSTPSSSSSSSSILHASLRSTPPKIVSANGNYLYTDTGYSILDATGGAAVACLGHNHPRVKAAIQKQLDTGVAYAYSPFFATQPAEELAERLVASTNNLLTRAFIVSSGTEAIEAALKLSRQYFIELEGPSTKRKNFISRKQSYHGNTLGALAVGGHVARKAIYEDILIRENVKHVEAYYPYRGVKGEMTEEEYVDSLVREFEQEVERTGPETVCAFVAETMSGLTLGAVPAGRGYLKKMKGVCEKFGILFVLDEVMSGMGRTGTLHAWEQEEGVVPDLQTVAKGLGAGYEPIGALLVKKEVVGVLEKGSGGFVHSQTYQGHPVACAAALEVQKVVEEERLLENVRNLSPVLEGLLREKLSGHPNAGDVRGRGFMWGIELVKDKESSEPFAAREKVAARMHATGLQKEFGISILPGGGVADGVNGDVIMLAPAYNCTKEDLELMVGRTVKVVEHVLGKAQC